jgi:hypothetical protein
MPRGVFSTNPWAESSLMARISSGALVLGSSDWSAVVVSGLPAVMSFLRMMLAVVENSKSRASDWCDLHPLGSIKCGGGKRCDIFPISVSECI